MKTIVEIVFFCVFIYISSLLIKPMLDSGSTAYLANILALLFGLVFILLYKTTVDKP